MRISEVAELTGLSVSNIRFYEKKGLLAPSREEDSKYRNYSEQDIAQLKQIILYRKMNLPIETIYLLKDKEASLENVLRRQESELLAQRDMLQGAIELCRKILQEEDLQHVDVDYYLNYVYQEEKCGKRFGVIEEALEDWADFSRLSELMYPMMRKSCLGRLIQSPWIFRGISLLYLLLCVGLPIIEIWMQFHQRGPAQGRAVTFWIIWEVFLLYTFWRVRRLKNDRSGNESR